PCYGMAETTLIVSGGIPSDAPTVKHAQTSALEQHQVMLRDQPQPDSRPIVGCGQTLLDQTIVIANPRTQMPCPAGQVGEIWVSGKNVALGYWNQPQATEETFNAYLADSQEGPFLRTGDLGFLLDGELYVTGRMKDVIILRGQNHYPQDIEATVQKSHPSLRAGRGAAFVVEQDNQARLIIVQEVERTHLRKLDVKEVVRKLCEAVATHHGLQVYAAALVKPSSIPLTSSGKIQRYACRTGYLDGALQTIHALSSPLLGRDHKPISPHHKLMERQIPTAS
ncbi:MAG: AMP-binding protein, partial [Pseudanabaenales cyanobacterium]|nr:AMP-binding protein [Pseudanabaenales cyanobacterium]